MRHLISRVCRKRTRPHLYLHLFVLRFTQLFCLRERLFYSLTRLSNDKDQHVYTFSRLLRPRISLACVRYLPSLSRGHVGSSDIVLEKAPARPARACLPPIRAASCCPVLASAYQLGELNSVVSNSQSAVLNVWSWNLLVFTVWVPHVQDCTLRIARDAVEFSKLIGRGKHRAAGGCTYWRQARASGPGRCRFQHAVD